MRRFLAMVKVILISIILFGSILIFIPPAAGAQVIPTVNIALTEVSKTAHVGPGENGTVTFTGVVSVTMNQATRVVVSLTASDTWDSSVVSPDSLLFDANGDKPFSVSVRAPPGTSFSNTGTVTVTGRWTMYPGGITGQVNPSNGAQGVINIAQYFKFSIGSEADYQEAKPGADVRFDLEINNEGNWFDSFSIELTNDNDLLKSGLDCELTQSTIEIGEKLNETIGVNIETPTGSNSVGTYRIKVKVQSDKGVPEGIPPQTLDFTLKLTNNPKYDPNTYVPDDETNVEPEDVENVGSDENELIAKSDLILILIAVIIILIILAIFGWTRSKKRRRDWDDYY